MDKNSTKFLNAILAVGLIFIFVGFIGSLIIVAFAGNDGFVSFEVLPILICLAGLVNIFICIAIKKSSFNFFLASFFSLNGIFSLLLTLGFFNMTLDKMWPVFMILTSISLTIAARSIRKKFVFSLDFTSCILFVLGIYFLLLSNDIVKITFTQLAFISVPVILILSGILLVVLFFHRKALLDMLPQDISDEFSKDSETEFEDGSEE